MSNDVIDWTGFDEFPEDTCYCKCGNIYQSHAKIVMRDKPFIVSRKPCRNCNKTEGHLRRVSSEPEIMRL